MNDVVIRNKKACLLILKPNIRLAPGVNRIKVEEFNIAKQHYGFQMFLDAGFISIPKYEVIDVEVEEENTEKSNKVESLKGLDAKKAIKVINAEQDAAKLQLWFEQEERVSVKSALERRLEVLVPSDL